MMAKAAAAKAQAKKVASKATKSSATKQEAIIDVAEPGKTAPPATSKPVIVTNRPILKDPMVNHDDDHTVATDEATAPPSKTTARHTELSLPELPIETVADDEATDQAAGAETSAPATEAEVSGAEATQPANTTEEAASEAANVSVESSDKPPAQPESLQPQLDTAVAEKLVESKRYFLPIKTVEQRHAQHFIIGGIVLSVLLLLLWVDIALDAGLIHIEGIKPITHFFST